MIEMKFTALVTIMAILFTFMSSLKVGTMRPRKNIKAPATTGDDEFERAFRVHYNTIEQLVIFLPALWLAVLVLGDMWAAAVGVFWVIGRVMYANAYMADPAKRTSGFTITFLSTTVLTGAALWGVIKAFIA